MKSSALNALRAAMTIVVATVVLATATVVGTALAELRRDAPGGALSGSSASPSPSAAVVRPIPWSGRVAPSWTPAPIPSPTPLSVRYCEPADLATSAGWSAGLSHSYTGITLANTAPTACQLSGRAKLTAVDAAGAVKATLSSMQDELLVPPPMLLTPGHAAPAAREPGRPGEAKLLVDWVAWCGEPLRVSALRIQLVTGMLLIPLPPRPGPTGEVVLEPRCDLGPTMPKTASLLITDFRPSDPKPDPTPTWPPLVLSARIDAPSRLDDNAGTLRYTVTLTNATPTTYTFGSCPIFSEEFIKNFRRYYLPCEAAPSLSPGASATFSMELPLDPQRTPLGMDGELLWFLEPPLDAAIASARITIAAPALRPPAPKPSLPPSSAKP